MLDTKHSSLTTLETLHLVTHVETHETPKGRVSPQGLCFVTTFYKKLLYRLGKSSRIDQFLIETPWISLLSDKPTLFLSLTPSVALQLCLIC